MRIGAARQDQRRRQLTYRPADDEPKDVDVDVGGPSAKKSPSFEMRGDQVFELAPAPPQAENDNEDDFYRNLALDYDDDFLNDLGASLTEQVEDDYEERSKWRDRFEKGLEMMGLVESDIDDGPFPGASNAIHPLLIEAVTQFWARAMGELWPPDGPAKGKVFGSQTQDKVERASRVAEYLNFEMTILDEGYMAETSRLVWAVPFYGSAFRKTYRDPILDQTVGIYVPADDMIVPAEATDLRTCNRFTHRMKKTHNELVRMQISGYYRSVEVDLPGDEDEDRVQELKDETQDVSPDGDDASTRHELLECCTEIELPGDEHVNAEGEETGLKRSYYVTVDKHTSKVLSIYRGWDQNDAMCRRKIYFEHYQYTPGMGFYGYGLFHLIGGLQIAATGALRVLLDSAATASLSGGFVSRHANLKGKRLVLNPGQWEPVDATADDLQKLFFSPPVKEPSPALFQLLGFLTERAEKFTSTTELMTGDQDPKGAPVGTTQMMVEQGGKVMSTIHRMMHTTLGRELRCRYELARQFAPATGYPYDPGDGQQRAVYYDDFAEGVAIQPVSDPNIFSSAQRMAQGQMVYQVALESGVIPLPKAVRRLLEAARIPDIDDLMPQDIEPKSYDPVGEIQALFLGKPVLVTPEQPHVMHLQVLAAFANNPQYGGNEQVQKQIGPQLLSIIGQHMAYAWATHARGLGVPAGYMDPSTGQVGQGGTPEQIAAVLAQVAPALATVPGLPAIDTDGKDGKGDIEIKRAELALKKEEHQQDMQMKVAEHEMDLKMQESKLAAQQQSDKIKANLAVQKGQIDAQVAQQTGAQKMQQAQMEAQQNQAMTQQKMSMEQQSMAQEHQMNQHRMHQEAAMGQQEMQHKQAMGEQSMAQEKQAGEQKMALDQQKGEQEMALGARDQTRQMHAGRVSAGGGDRLGHLRQPTQPRGRGV